MEELTQDSSALKPHLLPELDTLRQKVPELVDFGITVSGLSKCQNPRPDSVNHIQLAHSVLPYLNGVQNNKGTLQTKTVLDFVKQNALTLSPGQKESSSWDIVSNAIKRLTQEASAVVPIVLEPENVIKSKLFDSNYSANTRLNILL